MTLKRVMLAAPKSGSGKTTITCALLQALKDNGEQVISYKCGPDYIDPMFHQKVIDIPSKNLDTFFTGDEMTKQLFLHGRKETDFAVMEGVMGLFDGLGGVREEGSSYHLAKVTKTPIILVIDAKGMGRSILSLIAGFLSYDTEHLIRGVILNRMSKGYYDIVRPLIEEEMKIKVVGCFPEQKQMKLESRHLGLVMPQEIEDIKEQLGQLAKEFVKTVSIEKISEIAGSAEELYCCNTVLDKRKTFYEIISRYSSACERMSEADLPVIAVAKDEAFCFYYEDNLSFLREYGAKIEYFSPIHDKKIPSNCHALLFGGGYPELYAEKLSMNKEMKHSVKDAIENGMPVVAECGGFMYLHSVIIDKEGNEYEMADVIKGTCSYKGKLVRFGYINIEETKTQFLSEGTMIKGHEFHYFDSSDNGKDCLATKPVTGRSYSCIISDETKWIGFPHLYYPSNPEFAKNFVEKAREYKIHNKEKQ